MQPGGGGDPADGEALPAPRAQGGSITGMPAVAAAAPDRPASPDIAVDAPLPAAPETAEATAAAATQPGEPGADAAEIELAIGEDPLYLGEQTFVFPVASIDGLDEAGRGIVLERHAGSAEDNPASFLLEARFDEAALAARMMLAAARALPTLKSGAWSLLDLPAGALWGELRADEEKEWL